jgi:hypothetical protein
LIDADGDYVIAKDRDELDQLYIDEINDAAGIPKRQIAVKLRVPAPVEITVSADVPPEPSAVDVVKVA